MPKFNSNTGKEMTLEEVVADMIDTNFIMCSIVIMTGENSDEGNAEKKAKIEERCEMTAKAVIEVISEAVLHAKEAL